MATHSTILGWKIQWIGGAWSATVHGVAKSRTWLSEFSFFLFFLLAVLGLCCCARAFSSCGKWSYSSLQCVGFSLRGLSYCGALAVEIGLSSYGSLAQLLWDIWDLPRSGIESVSPILPDGFLTTGPPEASWDTGFFSVPGWRRYCRRIPTHSVIRLCSFQQIILF